MEWMDEIAEDALKNGGLIAAERTFLQHQINERGKQRWPN
jgi:hypothetical protein